MQLKAETQKRRIAESESFRNNNIKSISAVIPTIRSLVEEEITASVDSGVRAVEITVDTYKKQGKKLKNRKKTLRQT